MFHNVNGDVRILEDIDSLITVSDTKGDVFKSNQTIRVCDQIANDTAVLFNTRYLAPCRTMRRAESLSGTIFASSIRPRVYSRYRGLRPRQRNPWSRGARRKAVLCTVKDLNVVNAMAQLYMSVIIM